MFASGKILQTGILPDRNDFGLGRNVTGKVRSWKAFRSSKEFTKTLCVVGKISSYDLFSMSSGGLGRVWYLGRIHKGHSDGQRGLSKHIG